jgi:threonine aldolase
MYSFRNDYSEGAHPRVMEALIKTNHEQTTGYGTDEYCAKARDIIMRKCRMTDGGVHFLVGGTQVNLVCACAFLKPFEAVIAPCTGHPLVHETGAFEATGHKVISVPSDNGKILPAQVREVCENHSSEHMVRPKMLYISDSTEVGTAYSAGELAALRAACTDCGLILYLDGARLGCGITSAEGQMGFDTLAENLDAFTIGGTKNGALFGEALVITNPALDVDFRYYMKQRGALLAKGRLLGIQFSALLEDDLYLELARHANALANRMQDGIEKLGYGFMIKTPTNQIFPIFPNSVLSKLSRMYDYEIQKKSDGKNTCVRFVTSWATPEEIIPKFLADLGGITR